MLAGGWGAEQSPAHGHPSLTGTGCARLTIRLPLDPLSKLLSTKHAGYNEGREGCHHGNLDTSTHPCPSQTIGPFPRHWLCHPHGSL